jgi:Polyketide cyclase / dehydrase and lipid transport
MLKKVVIALGIVIVLFFALVAMQPAEFKVERSMTIAAPDSVLFAQVNDFHNWSAWSPWARLDTAMRQTYEGPGAGTGASYSWAGNRQVGEGRMTITESQPHSRVQIRLEFLKPFPATHTTAFTFTPAAGGTTVTWSMSGENNFMAKAVGLFMSMDQAVGGDFEKGLARLKKVAETGKS